jgi:hypothetical protein
MGREFLILLLWEEIGKDIEKERVSAEELSLRLSGSALGIANIAGLIHKRRWTISDFMSIYINNHRRVHGSEELQALWDFSFQRFHDDARKFLEVISFLMPDDIPESLFKVKELLPHIYSHQANLCKGLGNVKRSIELNNKGYKIRLEEDPNNQVLCYGFEANLGYTYNTADAHETAMNWFSKARKRWEWISGKGNDDLQGWTLTLDPQPTTQKRD